MALLNIIEVPHPVLRKKAKEVPPDEINESMEQFIQNMIDTMREAPGVGLAAPQVSVSKRIIVVDVSREYEGKSPFGLINPVIVEKSGEGTIEEGCLSIPEFRAEIPRAKKVKVEYLDPKGNSQVIEDEDFLAVVLQHEIDHLNGITMLDHVSPMKREMYLRKMKKLKRRGEPAKSAAR